MPLLFCKTRNHGVERSWSEGTAIADRMSGSRDSQPRGEEGSGAGSERSAGSRCHSASRWLGVGMRATIIT